MTLNLDMWNTKTKNAFAASLDKEKTLATNASELRHVSGIEH